MRRPERAVRQPAAAVRLPDGAVLRVLRADEGLFDLAVRHLAESTGRSVADLHPGEVRDYWRQVAAAQRGALAPTGAGPGWPVVLLPAPNP